MDDDPQALTRRDFPISRRGYQPAAVDAHLSELAAEIERLRGELGPDAGAARLASSASTQVQAVIAAAETAAANIEREAVEKARSQVAAVSEAVSALLHQVSAMDAELGVLADSLRALGPPVPRGGTSVEVTAAGRSPQKAPLARARARDAVPEGGRTTDAASPDAGPSTEAATPEVGTSASADAATLDDGTSTAENGGTADRSSDDVDGARLVALNMALSGESRSDTERYLAENFTVPDHEKLVEEVYAAIDG